MSDATRLQRDVLDELDWDPRVDAANIGVTVTDGVVTLAGTVVHFEDRFTAERAAKRVAGVKGVANELQVALASSGRRTDTDIAQTAVHALEWNTSVPKDRIKVAVRNAWVTLDGEVEWQFQRMAADHAVRGLPGVYGVTNMITVKPGVTPTDIKSRIENALRRAAEVDAKHVTVQADGSRVTLAGNVRSWAERDDAENAAWSAPGVTDVTNRIRIEDNVALGV